MRLPERARADSPRLRGPRLALATGLGLGYAPLAPGTAGSLGGLLLVWLLWRSDLPAAVGGGALVALFLGLASASVAESHFGRRDPGHIVIDEIAGQMVSLAFLAPGGLTLVAGFALFRLFDIWKPFPVRRLESLPGASGIMADDLMAGVYANIANQALQWGLRYGWPGT